MRHHHNHSISTKVYMIFFRVIYIFILLYFLEILCTIFFPKKFFFKKWHYIIALNNVVEKNKELCQNIDFTQNVLFSRGLRAFIYSTIFLSFGTLKKVIRINCLKRTPKSSMIMLIFVLNITGYLIWIWWYSKS